MTAASCSSATRRCEWLSDRILPHREHIGVQFTGELEVPRAGLYRFFLKSDDGSQLFVGNSSLRVAVRSDPAASGGYRRPVHGRTRSAARRSIPVFFKIG